MSNEQPIEAPECIRCKYIVECDIKNKMMAAEKKCIKYDPRGEED